jgi:hypothetical protein
VINIGEEERPRLITCVKASQGFTWNQGTSTINPHIDVLVFLFVYLNKIANTWVL